MPLTTVQTCGSGVLELGPYPDCHALSMHASAYVHEELLNSGCLRDFKPHFATEKAGQVFVRQFGVSFARIAWVLEKL